MDVYEQSEIIERELAGIHPSWAERVHWAVASASTGTEAHAALRWTLREVIRSEPTLPDHLRTMMESVAEAIDARLAMD